MGACTTKLDEKTIQQNSIVRSSAINQEIPNSISTASHPAKMIAPKLQLKLEMPSHAMNTLAYFPDFYYYDRISGKVLSITKSSSTEVILKVNFSFPQECAIGHLKDKSIMLVGGTIESVMVPVVALIYPSSTRAYELPHLPIPCKNGQIHEIGEWIYYIGGEAMGHKGLTQAPLMRFSFKLRLWQDLLKISEQFRFNRIVNMGTCVMENKLLLVGGQRKNKSGELKNSKKIYSIAVENDFKLELEAKLPIKIVRPSIATGLKHGIIAGGINTKTNLPNRCCFYIIVKDQIYNVYQMEDLSFDLTETYPTFYQKDYVMFISYPNLALRVKHVSNWIEYAITGKNTRTMNKIKIEKTAINESQTSEESEMIENASKIVLTKDTSKSTDIKLMKDISNKAKLEVLAGRGKIASRNSANCDANRDYINPFIHERRPETVDLSGIRVSNDILKNDKTSESNLNIARTPVISLDYPVEQEFMRTEKIDSSTFSKDRNDLREVKNSTEKISFTRMSKEFSNKNDLFSESPNATIKSSHDHPFIENKEVVRKKPDFLKFSPLPTQEDNKTTNPSLEEFKIWLKQPEISESANISSSRESIQPADISNLSELSFGRADNPTDLDAVELLRHKFSTERNTLVPDIEIVKVIKPNNHENISEVEDSEKTARLDKNYKENKTSEFSLNIKEKIPENPLPGLSLEPKDPNFPLNKVNIELQINHEIGNLDTIANYDSKESNTSYDSSSSMNSYKFNSITDFDKLRQVFMPPSIAFTIENSNIKVSDTRNYLILKEKLNVEQADLLRFNIDNLPLKSDQEIIPTTPNYSDLPKEIYSDEQDEHFTKENSTPKPPSVRISENKTELIKHSAQPCLPKLKLEALNQKKGINPSQFDIDINLIEIKKDELEEVMNSKQEINELEVMNPPNTDNLYVNMNTLEQRPSSRCLPTVAESASLKPHEPYAEDPSMNKSPAFNFLNVDSSKRIPISITSKITNSTGVLSPMPAHLQEQHKIKLSFGSENTPGSMIIGSQMLDECKEEYSGRPKSNGMDKVTSASNAHKTGEVKLITKAPPSEFISGKQTVNEFMDFEIVSGINLKANPSTFGNNDKFVNQKKTDIIQQSLIKHDDPNDSKKVGTRLEIIEEDMPKTMTKTKSLGKVGLRKFKPFLLPQGVMSTKNLKAPIEIISSSAQNLHKSQPLSSEKSSHILENPPSSIQRKGLYELPEMHEKLEIDKLDDGKGHEIQIHHELFVNTQPEKISEIDMKKMDAEVFSEDSMQKFFSILKNGLQISKEIEVPHVKTYSQLSKCLKNELKFKTFFRSDFVAVCSKIHELSGKKKFTSKQCYKILTKYGVKDDQEVIHASTISRALCKALKFVFLKKS